MIAILADHNIEEQAELLWGTLVTEGWLELCPVELVLFADIGLSPESAVWRLAQERGMVLLTDNRSKQELAIEIASGERLRRWPSACADGVRDRVGGRPARQRPIGPISIGGQVDISCIFDHIPQLDTALGRIFIP